MLLITVVWPYGSRRVGVGLTRPHVKARGFRALRPTTMPMLRVYVLCCSRLRERIRFFIDRSAFLRIHTEKRTDTRPLECVSSHCCRETHSDAIPPVRFFSPVRRNAPEDDHTAAFLRRRGKKRTRASCVCPGAVLRSKPYLSAHRWHPRFDVYYVQIIEPPCSPVGLSTITG